MRPLRLWPGVIAAVLLVLLRFVMPLVVPSTFTYALIGGLACVLAIALWWLFFSRAPWLERLGAIALMAGAVVAVAPLVHISIRGGMMGLMLPLYSIFVLPLALVAGAALSRGRTAAFRRAAIAGCILLAMAGFTAVRTEGISSQGSQVTWRWTPTPEERLLAQPPVAPASVAAPIGSAAPSKDARWPGFRGPNRDGVVHAVKIRTDWTASPPEQLWRKPIGPGWSSFAVDGDFFYTQEQLGEHEIVACFKLMTGEVVWTQRSKVRFWESNAGAGPRATPTLSDGRVYALGATGLLNVLDAATGNVLWSRDAAKDANRKTPMWGFSGSPLIVDDLVVVAASGNLMAYDRTSGTLRWSGPARPGSYSSPHLATIGGMKQILLVTVGGVMGVAPGDGALLWEHTWTGDMTIVQPAVVGDGEILISTSGAAAGYGIRSLSVTRGGDGRWTVTERWTSIGFKPYFNDFVVHKGHAYGFDGAILSCIDLKDGTRVWKGGRYGNGQLMLLADQDVLLVVSEDGELALVSATPNTFNELARIPAIEGKTWNHPVLVGDTLLVRNGEEKAAFRLSAAGR
jgi:outer membrane protein assembly factor BamB